MTWKRSRHCSDIDDRHPPTLRKEKDRLDAFTAF
uniref:Uncharacterized protein n=1 Tax=Arundo donax TaxID=35708 RepID=A0A0A8YFJ2_ARUDO